MTDRPSVPEAYELEPAIAWDMWDAAVAMQDRPSPTSSPAFADMVARNAVPPWRVGVRHG